MSVDSFNASFLWYRNISIWLIKFACSPHGYDFISRKKLTMERRYHLKLKQKKSLTRWSSVFLHFLDSCFPFCFEIYINIPLAWRSYNETVSTLCYDNTYHFLNLVAITINSFKIRLYGFCFCTCFLLLLDSFNC